MTMVVQHLENRLALNSVHPNDQLHEFQIVHALITQCRKQGSCEESDNHGFESSDSTPPHDLKDRSVGVGRNDKTSFVHTIRQTFNALAQATNPSLCAKQNAAQPVTIASTVKNIISQFSRQTCHTALNLSNPQPYIISKSNAPQNESPPGKDPPTVVNRPNAEPSTSQKPVLEKTEIKSATVLRQKNISNVVSTKPKTRVVRARYGNSIARHGSAPPQFEQGGCKTVKKTASVKRSKSDADCYGARAKQNRRRIDSNVQTKVLHFEKCRKASMCVECCRRSLEEELSETPHPNRSPTASRADSIIPKQESFMGALSYHKPSIISRNSAPSSAGSSDELGADTLNNNDSDNADNRPQAIACPGGTYFPATFQGVAGFKDARTQCAAEDIGACDMSGDFDTRPGDSGVELGVNGQDVVSCDKHDVKSQGHHCIADVSLTETMTLSSNTDYDTKSGWDISQPDSTNLYTILCGRDTTDIVDDLPGTYDDSSDNADSCESSSSESVISPRRGYLARGGAAEVTPVRRAPSTRYKRMRRRLKKLITRSKPCVETVRQEEFATQAEREEQFLSSLKVTTPNFMLTKGTASFDAMRQQLAMRFEPQHDMMQRLPDHVLVQVFSHLDTRTLATLKCVCKDFNFLINSYDIRGIDSLWNKDERYIDDPCRFCRKTFAPGDVSMCRYHAKYYHCDLPYGRSYWMCCFQIEKNAPGCKTGIHDNHWALVQQDS